MSKKYAVGGQVRDKLMGITPSDLDYVIVGSSPEEMLSAGHKMVGSSFPVFLDKDTGDELALARTEYSTGNSYKDFKCSFGEDVTLEDDLLRRDLTLNSIAQDIETGEYIDPYGGITDIENKLLRHTSESFRDDSTRVLRLARFYARFGRGWVIAPETLKICIKMYGEGMLENLTPERVFMEIQKALHTKTPSLFFEFLFKFDIFPEITSMWGCPQNIEHHPEIEYTASELYMDKCSPVV